MGIVKRSPLVCFLLATVATPALADNLTISSIVSSPAATATAANGSAGNITIQSGGGISINAAGAAVVLNSSNSITNQGIIQNAYTGGGAIGVHILGGNTGSFEAQVLTSSIINVAGGGANNFGILVDGSSPFTGSITLGAVSTLNVTGPNANGIAIKTPLSGSLTVGANTSATGENANGVLVLSPISGSLSVLGALSAVGTNTFTLTNIEPLAGSALAIGSSISGGIIAVGPTAFGELTSSSTIVSSGTAPALAIQPSMAGTSASNIVIGSLPSDAVSPSFSFIGRGTVRGTSNDPGISTVAMGIGETAAAAHTVTLTGGIYNRGLIEAQAQTSNVRATSAASASADATAIRIGNGASINASALTAEAFRNEGTTQAFVDGNLSGTATGVLILAGGSLPSLTNTFLLQGQATSSNTAIATLNAYGIRDLSGTLTTVNNSGILLAGATTLDNGAQVTVAADLSHSSQAQTFSNTGAIAGDLLFGSGNSLLAIEGNSTLNGCTAACVRGSVRATGSGGVDVVISPNGGGGLLRTTSSQVRNLNVGSGGTLEISVSKSSGAAPALVASGAANFATGSRLTVVPTTFLPNSGNFTLVRSAGGLNFADLNSTVSVAIPFIFNGAVTQQGNDLVLAVQRKTVTELGLTGTAAQIYEPLVGGALNDNAFGAALLTLTSASDVEAAVTSTVPDIGGGVRALGIALTDQATGVIASRERAMVTAPAGTRNDFRFWGQEFYNNVNENRTATRPGYNGAGQGVAVGVEWGNLGTGRYGVGYTFFASQEVEDRPRDTKTNGDWNLISLYGGWRAGDFFVTPQVNLGEGTFHGRRTVAAGSYVRTATADYTSYLAAGGLTTGYVIDVGGFQIVPQIAVDGLYLRQGTYTESGAGGIGLSLKSQNQQSFRSFAGVLGQGSYTWDKGILQPQLLIGWTHEFKDSPATIDGTFESAPGSPFHLVGPTLEANHVVGGASFAYVLGSWAAGINYDASASTGSLAQSATLSLSSRF